tara:strand:- start:173 stop:415 length:243 start_codon:yes stop_codon:yes gene_type:complete
MIKLLTPILPLIPQPYKNMIKFFIGAISGLNAKRLANVSAIFIRATADGKISANEWNELGGRNGLGIVGGSNGKKSTSKS